MKTPHFRKWHWFYVPHSLPAALLTLALFLHTLWVANVIDHHSHSVSDTLYSLFPFAACTFFIYEWIAKNLNSRS